LAASRAMHMDLVVLCNTNAVLVIRNMPFSLDLAQGLADLNTKCTCVILLSRMACQVALSLFAESGAAE
ncbi:hypothetical protein KI387_010644, partial [Taxus chinensis]